MDSVYSSENKDYGLISFEKFDYKTVVMNTSIIKMNDYLR